MGYLKIPNLYKNTTILNFREGYALEKVHGTSTSVRWEDGKVKFFAGGCSHENFVAIFDADVLAQRFQEVGADSVVVYGEAYGGKLQGMRGTYGAELRFVAFDVTVNNMWYSVPTAAAFVASLGLEFVPWLEGPMELEWLDKQRDAESVIALRRGCGGGKKREGIVIRPLVEMVEAHGQRVIVKHKRDDFRETKTRRQVGVDPAILEDARAIVEEWVTEMRLTHVLDEIEGVRTKAHTGEVVRRMIEDVRVEGEGEIVWTKAAQKAVGARAAQMFHARLAGRPSE